MTYRPPADDADIEIVALDAALDSLARRDRVESGDALAALAGFARAIDERATALETAGTPTGRPRRPQGSMSSRTRRPVTPRHAGRPRRARRRLLAIPLLACVVLAIAIPLSASPHAPLYPLHHLLFQQDQPSAAESARRHLANARQALDLATASTGTARVGHLADAKRSLADARRLLPRVTDDAMKHQLDVELDGLEQGANQLERSEEQGTAPESSNPHDEGSGGESTVPRGESDNSQTDGEGSSGNP